MVIYVATFYPRVRGEEVGTGVFTYLDQAKLETDHGQIHSSAVIKEYTSEGFTPSRTWKGYHSPEGWEWELVPCST